MTLTKKIKTNSGGHSCYEAVCPAVFIFSTYQYGEEQPDDKEHNLRGQLCQHYDGGGLQQIREYDFKGNALATQQQLLEDPTLTDGDYAGRIFRSIVSHLFRKNEPLTFGVKGGVF